MLDSTMMDENRKKLESETQSLNCLKELSQTCCSHTLSIRSILSEFDDRLAKLERNIQPVYKQTGNLQTKQSELVETLDRLDHVIQNYSVTNEVERTIKAGPANRLNNYMQCLKKLSSSIEYFKNNNHESPEYMNVTTLFKIGCDLIEKEFKVTLQRYSSPIAPIALLDIINDDTSEQQLDSTNSSSTTATSTSGSLRRQQPELPADKIDELRTMCEWLSHNRPEILLNLYSDLRSDYISKSLKSLQDYQKSRSVTYNVMNPSGMPGSSRSSVDSPDLAVNKKRVGVTSSTSSRDSSYRRTPKSIQLAFKRKFHNVMPSDVMASHKLSSTSLDELTIHEREIVSYLTCITAFHKLAVNELTLMSNIVPANCKTEIYNRLITESLKLIYNEANNLTVRVKKSIARHDFKSALYLFPILRHQTLRRNNFDLLFDGCNSEALKKFQGLTITFQATIHKSLEEFAAYLQTDNDTKVPGDGTVHELTNNVIIFIEQLHDYLDIMSSVIPVRDMQAMEYTADKDRLGFAQYILRLLTSLGSAIMKKSDTYENEYLVILFNLNNFHYILKRLRESGLLEIVHYYEPKVEEQYEKIIREYRNAYVDKFGRVTYYLNELQDTRTKSIKDRFAGFNKDFLDLHKQNRAFAVPDQELRCQMRDACKRLLLPLYHQFYTYFVDQDFSKNKEKYVKFTSEDLSAMIDQFFESN